MAYRGMEPDILAERVGLFHDTLAAADPAIGIHGAIGGLRYEIVGAEEASPFPSGNPNRARWYQGELDEAILHEAISRFDAHQIPVWFVHALAPSDHSQIEDCCERAGLERFDATTYPLLAHDLTQLQAVDSPFEIHAVGAVPPQHAGMLTGPLHGEPAMALAQRGQLTFFGAYSERRLVALAGVMVIANMAYLGWAVTREDQRGRGAHRALIQARLAHARAVGCQVALAETLGMLRTSLANLEQAGFTTVAERLVMRCGEAE